MKTIGNKSVRLYGEKGRNSDPPLLQANFLDHGKDENNFSPI